MIHANGDSYWKEDDTETYSTILYVNHTKNLIQKHVNSKSDAPLLLYIALQDAHIPYRNFTGVHEYLSNKQINLLNELDDTYDDDGYRQGFARSTMMLDWAFGEVMEVSFPITLNLFESLFYSSDNAIHFHIENEGHWTR